MVAPRLAGSNTHTSARPMLGVVIGALLAAMCAGDESASAAAGEYDVAGLVPDEQRPCYSR